MNGSESALRFPQYHTRFPAFYPLLGEGVAGRQFNLVSGRSETFLVVAPEATGDIHQQIRSLKARYASALLANGVSHESCVFRRIFLSDFLNQRAVVAADAVLGDTTLTALSLIGQAPAAGTKISMLAQHVVTETPLARERLSENHLLLDDGRHRTLWTTGLNYSSTQSAPGAGVQTRAIFSDLTKALEGLGATLKDNCVRTWIYLKDVDYWYPDMVSSRRTLFDEQGLTEDTHYIASTGIEGTGGGPSDLVSMDAYSILDVEPGQITYLNDYLRLCPTKRYGVTFERATKVACPDHSRIFISGTAAIDAQGGVLHRGDVVGQLGRALDNVDALLRQSDAHLDDLIYLLIYLRDPSDFPQVRDYLDRRAPSIPALFVRGAVCRPEWLIEVEGEALTRATASAAVRSSGVRQ